MNPLPVAKLLTYASGCCFAARRGIGLLAVGLAVSACAAATTTLPRHHPAAYHYTVNLRRLDAQHRLRVRVDLPPSAAAQATFIMPKLVPGIYGTLNFGQYVTQFAAFDDHNQPLTVTRPDTNSWHIADARRLHHLTYAVRQTWREATQTDKTAYKAAGSSYHADSVFVLNYGSFVGYFDHQPARPYEVKFVRPSGFYGASYLTPLPLTDSTDLVRAPTYPELVDAPVLYARPDTAWLQLGKTRVLLALYDATAPRPYAATLVPTLRRLLTAQQAYLGGKLPVDKYSVLLYRTQGPAGGRLHGEGLEHGHSTLCLAESADRADLNTYVYHVVGHEFFHIITPLGLHSQQIAHFNFRHPVFSQHLWLYEGLTEYETIHVAIREHLETLPEFLAVLSQKAAAMSKFDDTLPLTQLSREAAVRQDQYLNVYQKGALFNLCLDIKLRELSGGKFGTQELTQRLLRRYGAQKSFPDDHFFRVLTHLTYPQLRAFFRTYLEEGHALPLAETLAAVGLTYQPATHQVRVAAHPTAAQLALRRAWIGQ